MGNPDTELAMELQHAYRFLAEKYTNLHVDLVDYSTRAAHDMDDDPYFRGGREKLQRVGKAMEWLDREIEALLL